MTGYCKPGIHSLQYSRMGNEAINEFSTHVDKRFTGLEGEISSMQGDVKSLKSDVNSFKSTMITKDYLDEKLSDLRGDLVVMLRKEDRKFGALIAELLERKIIDESAARRIMTMEPFAQVQ